MIPYIKQNALDIAIGLLVMTGIILAIRYALIVIWYAVQP